LCNQLAVVFLFLNIVATKQQNFVTEFLKLILINRVIVQFSLTDAAGTVLTVVDASRKRDSRDDRIQMSAVSVLRLVQREHADQDST